MKNSKQPSPHSFATCWVGKRTTWNCKGEKQTTHGSLSSKDPREQTKKIDSDKIKTWTLPWNFFIMTCLVIEFRLTNRMRQKAILSGDFSSLKVGGLKSHVRLPIHSINYPSSLEPHTESRTPKFWTVQTTEDFPWCGTGLSVVRNCVNRTCCTFLQPNNFAKPPEEDQRRAVIWKMVHVRSWISLQASW